MKKINIKAALIISIFGGYLGLDRFYQGDYKLGAIKLFTLGLYGMWWIVDIYLLFKKQNKEDAINISNTFKKIMKPILYVFGLLFLLFTILVLYFAITEPVTETNNSNIIIVEDNIIEEKQELDLNTKKDIYYIYWQAEHISGGLTIQKFGNGGEQIERDEFFKNTRLEYGKILSEKQGIDFETYSKNAIKISGEGEKNNWKIPTSEDDSVLLYIYGEEKFALMKATKNFINKDGDFLKKYNFCVGLVSGVLGPIQAANPQKIDDTHIDVYTYMTGKNAFGQKVRENITCMYEYYPKSKSYSITGIK